VGGSDLLGARGVELLGRQQDDRAQRCRPSGDGERLRSGGDVAVVLGDDVRVGPPKAK